MAKAKKKKLSLEELLEEAIVKEEDRPYEVPENWVWTRLGAINNFIGKSINPAKEPTRMFELYSVLSCEANYPEVIFGDEIGSTKQEVSQGDILLCKINPRINRVWIVSKHTEYELIASSEWIVISNALINSRYLMWCMKSKYFREYLLSNVSGVGGSLMRAQPKFVKEYPIPIPPLPEQQRIVELIESLFKKLDAARELVQNVLDSFENRKAAILHKAFTGELTAKWREENGVSFNEWEEKELDELCTSFQYGTSKKSETSGDVAVLRMGNMQGGEFIWDKLVYTSDEEDIKKYLLKSGDVLFNRTNSPELVGKTSIYRGELPAIFAGYLIRINYKACLIGEYLNYVLNSPKARCYCNEVKSDGVNQSNINAKKLAQFKIPFCSLEEQQEIVRILDNLLGNEQRAKELCDVIEKIDLMKKAILSKAFRGELGTNNPEEESAVELLKEVLKEKL